MAGDRKLKEFPGKPECGTETGEAGTVICFMESDVLYQNELTYEQDKKEMVEILMKGIKAGGKSKNSGN
ncbi:MULTISPECIES: hypothetical protein [Blautia]|uniref:hypothetical protein n=1 Tax=Blautia TaxID=572511 RepID=UPI000E4A2995|nr:MULTISPECIES: hypothetical protein [Blautia]RHA46944.1 hypothetical protein DW934_11565 [Blautia obeum]